LYSFSFRIFSPPPLSTLFPYTTLFRSFYFFEHQNQISSIRGDMIILDEDHFGKRIPMIVTAAATDSISIEWTKQRSSFTCIEYLDRKSTRLNSSHVSISYAVFCLKKKI